jgi:transcriptional regulator with XRE-family HTH domain/quercetin dioxygenase-like cupin family protein
MLEIGQKLRAARVSQNLSLRELAAKAEVSASLLSQIENGKANPSVRSLHSIAEALALSVDHFFPQSKQAENITLAVSAEVISSELTTSQMRTTQGPLTGHGPGFENEDQRGNGPITRQGNRATIELQGGVTWTRLTPGPEENAEFLRVCYDVGATSGKKMSHHTAREFGMVLEGILKIELGFEEYLLQPGDTIIFDSTTPHRLTNAGEVPMRAIWVVFKR